MPFWNAEDLSEKLTDASMFWGVTEFDQAEQATMLIGSFMYENDAQDYADYLATLGRHVEVVDLMAIWHAYCDLT